MHRTRTLAHVSDLHVGHSRLRDRATAELCIALAASDVDAVLMTGDITHRGRLGELELFHHLCAPLLDTGKVVIVPGNHDRLGDDVSDRLMGHGGRVQISQLEDLHVVRIDSTGSHNRNPRSSHGVLSLSDLEEIDRALADAPDSSLRVLALHHHPLPLPDDSTVERFLSAVGIASSAELRDGADLIRRVIGACDLILHGHRHRPSVIQFGSPAAPFLGVYNAGSSSELQMVRIFEHRDGHLLHQPRWLRIADLNLPALARPVRQAPIFATSMAAAGGAPRRLRSV
jgi:3',5'-cyclic AMP phosphodiesterase CpdA